MAFNWQFDEELRVITHSCHSCVMKKPMAEKGEICQVKDIVGSNYACVLQSTDAFAHYYTYIKKVQFLGNAPFTYVEI